MKRTKWISMFTAVALAAAAIGTIGAPGLVWSAENKPAAGTSIKIDNFSFGPDVTIPVGSTVTWTNQDDVPHVVVSDDKLFKSKALDTDDRFTFTFTKPGTYLYYCAIHPKMTAKVVVQ